MLFFVQQTTNEENIYFSWILQVMNNLFGNWKLTWLICLPMIIQFQNIFLENLCIQQKKAISIENFKGDLSLYFQRWPDGMSNFILDSFFSKFCMQFFLYFEAKFNFELFHCHRMFQNTFDIQKNSIKTFHELIRQTMASNFNIQSLAVSKITHLK